MAPRPVPGEPLVEKPSVKLRARSVIPGPRSTATTSSEPSGSSGALASAMSRRCVRASLRFVATSDFLRRSHSRCMPCRSTHCAGPSTGVPAHFGDARANRQSGQRRSVRSCPSGHTHARTKPTFDSISNSLMSRRDPDSPSPKPSPAVTRRAARARAGTPGPLSTNRAADLRERRSRRNAAERCRRRPALRDRVACGSSLDRSSLSSFGSDETQTESNGPTARAASPHAGRRRLPFARSSKRSSFRVSKPGSSDSCHAALDVQRRPNAA